VRNEKVGIVLNFKYVKPFLSVKHHGIGKQIIKFKMKKKYFNIFQLPKTYSVSNVRQIK
jgi:hypothetical protein